MSNLAISIPPDAQVFMDRVRACTWRESIQASTPQGVKSLLIYPFSKIIWHGVIYPDDIKWGGEKPDKPYYLVMVQTPRHQPNQCDWWWFSMDLTITVEAVNSQTKGRTSTPPLLKQQKEMANCKQLP